MPINDEPRPDHAAPDHAAPDHGNPDRTGPDQNTVGSPDSPPDRPASSPADVPVEAPADAPAGAPRPVYRLLTWGYALFLTLVIMGITGSWWTLSLVEQRFEAIQQTWDFEDGTMEMMIGSLQGSLSLYLAEQHMTEASRDMRRSAVSQFHTSRERVRSSGLATGDELDTVEELFEEVLDSARERAETPAPPSVTRESAIAEPGTGIGTGPATQEAVSTAIRSRQQELYTTQTRMFNLLAGMDRVGDRKLEDILASTQTLVHTIFTGMLILTGVAIALYLAVAAYFKRQLAVGLGQPVRHITRSTEQLTETAQYQVKSAAEQSSAAMQIAATMKGLSASYEELTGKSRDMVQISKEAADECHKGHTFLTNSQEGMGTIKVEVERITDHMRSLEEKSRQINSVLEIINEMAAQTNLLSINATIEAAGAGESGRRFSVVAEEIRLLAERAVESTEEIRALIDDIQDTARVTSAATADGARAVGRGIEDTARVADNFNRLITLVTRTADAVQMIESTAREQGRSVEQVSEAVASLSHISGESERQSGRILETVRTLGLTARELATMASGKKAG